jgi:hypothetical protein
MSTASKARSRWPFNREISVAGAGALLFGAFDAADAGDERGLIGPLIALPQVDPEAVAGRIVEILPHPEIPLGGDDRGMTERELNLFESGASLVREFGEGAAEVVGGEVGDADELAVFQDGFHDVLRQQHLSREFVPVIHGTKNAAGR